MRVLQRMRSRSEFVLLARIIPDLKAFVWFGLLL